MFSFFRPSPLKAKRDRIAEHAALLAFLRESGDDAGNEFAEVIGHDEGRCLVEVRFGKSRPMDRVFYSVADGTCAVISVPMKEAVDQWGVHYER